MDPICIAHTCSHTREMSITSFVLTFSAARLFTHSCPPLLRYPRSIQIVCYPLFLWEIRIFGLIYSFSSFPNRGLCLPCEVLHSCYFLLLRAGLVSELICLQPPLTGGDSREVFVWPLALFFERCRQASLR